MDFKQFSNLIMIEQTLFALPFALIGLLFAGGGRPAVWIWTVVALVAARTAGMSFNRAIDAEIDSRNPRTRDRLIPRGEISRSAVWLTGIISSLVLVGASFMLNRLCFYLSFPAVFLLVTYSYFKRFSASSHFYLGFVEAAAPVGGYIAVTGEFTLTPFVLGFAIMMWIAGLDMVYALQDMDFDATVGLYSVPVGLGKEKALLISAACYMSSMAALIFSGVLGEKGATYWLALVFVGLIFLTQQMLARRTDMIAAIKAFFKLNVWISPILFLGTFADLYL